ncbi:MAG: PBECR4 domain-containing protein [Psychrilyobacter sp.]|uniref:PBECR4 domain-containing protein n=1 Tax=Psychrilyobacter sp. TaxID=2586924 RepID=UPI003C754D2A
MKKEDALEIILNSFNIYKKEYVNKEVLFVYENNTGDIKGFESKFKMGNFKHLTGVESKHEGENFYKKLDRNQLSINDFEYNYEGTTIKKLNVINNLRDLIYKPYIIGPAKHDLLSINSSKIDIVTGNSKKLTVGFNLFTSAPITLLNKDIKDSTITSYPILFTLRKNISSQKYENILFWKNNISKKRLRKIEKQYQVKIDFKKSFDNWEF